MKRFALVFLALAPACFAEAPDAADDGSGSGEDGGSDYAPTACSATAECFAADCDADLERWNDLDCNGSDEPECYDLRPQLDACTAACEGDLDNQERVFAAQVWSKCDTDDEDCELAQLVCYADPCDMQDRIDCGIEVGGVRQHPDACERLRACLDGDA